MIQDPSMRADVGIPPLERSRERGRSGELDWLLDDLVVRVREVRHAVVLSNDGLAVGASSDLGREDAEHLAAVASGFHSLAKGAGRHFGAGGVRQTMVEMDDAFLFVAAAGEGSCLAVVTAVTADIGLVAYEMARLVKRVGEHLYTPPRAATHPSTATYPSGATRPPAAG
jgi:predicted regulator of Ras-like GTPase activity (Roadblock/LC7/MglB family)